MLIAQQPGRGLSVREAADRAGLSYSHFRRLLMAGEVASYKVGSRRIVPESELVAYQARMLRQAQEQREEQAG